MILKLNPGGEEVFAAQAEGVERGARPIDITVIIDRHKTSRGLVDLKRLVPAMMIPLLSMSLPMWGPSTGSFKFNTAISALAQEAHREGSVELTPSVLKESGCPVDIVSAKALLDFNTFGTPEYSRVYITYKNVSAKNIFSVNFRVRFTDNAGGDLGTFQGSRTCTVLPDGEGSEKWRKEGVLNPKISSYKVRVLQVKFEDGSQWESSAMATAGKTGQQQEQEQQQDRQQEQQQEQEVEPQQSQVVPFQPSPKPNSLPQIPSTELPPAVTPQETPQITPQQLPPIPFNTDAPNSTPGTGPVVNPADDSEPAGDAFTR